MGARAECKLCRSGAIEQAKLLGNLRGNITFFMENKKVDLGQEVMALNFPITT